MSKEYTIEVSRRGRVNSYSGTVTELVKCFNYTLETGASWSHERGNSKINTNPKTIKSLVSNLNKSKENAAANGCSDTVYSLAVETHS